MRTTRRKPRSSPESSIVNFVSGAHEIRKRGGANRAGYNLFPQHQLVKRSRQDGRRLQSLQSCLGEIGANAVEYRQSETLLSKVFNLGDILHTYAIAQRYPAVVSGQIKMYSHIGKLSVGIMYGVTGYKVLDFKYGIQQALRHIDDVREQVERSILPSKIRDKLVGECDAAVGIIKKEQGRASAQAAF